MAIILQTNTVLNIVDDDFTLVTTYSGGTNPNVTYTYTLTVTDTNSNIIEGAIVTIESVEYTTDSNGQIEVDLERGDYIATITKTGYTSNSDSFTILDTNVSNSVQLGSQGSFDKSFDNSFDSLQDIETFDDWFLPSKDELSAMRENLYLEGVGILGGGYHWTSSEIDNSKAYYMFSMDGGGFGTSGQKSDDRMRVIACRSFEDEVGAYVLRDVGPAGGLIFYIDGTTYYECGTEYLSTGYFWSNVDNALIGTTGTAIGTGKQNTLDIINQAGHTDSAALLCDELVINN